MHLLRTLPKEVSRSTATKVESGISDASRRSLVRERTAKKDRMLVEKSRSSLSQRAAEHLMQWVKKQKTWLLHRHSFERKSLSMQSQRKAKSKYGICAGFGWIVAGTKPSGRTLDLYIYIIYIANDESPSQHVTVGLAEARPNQKVFF